MDQKNNRNIKLIIIIAAVISIPVLLFIGTILYEWGMDARQNDKPMVFGSVDGDEISFKEYLAYLDWEKEKYEKANKKKLSGKVLENTKEASWNYFVEQKIIQKQLILNKIKVDDAEIDYIMYKNPELLPESVKKIFYDVKGNFDIYDYRVSMNTNTKEVEAFKEEVKITVKNHLEVQKVFNIITKDVKLSDDELKSTKDTTEANIQLNKKKDMEVEKWFEKMKRNSKIVDNRKKFEK